MFLRVHLQRRWNCGDSQIGSSWVKFIDSAIICQNSGINLIYSQVCTLPQDHGELNRFVAISIVISHASTSEVEKVSAKQLGTRSRLGLVIGIDSCWLQTPHSIPMPEATARKAERTVKGLDQTQRPLGSLRGCLERVLKVSFQIKTLEVGTHLDQDFLIWTDWPEAFRWPGPNPHDWTRSA